jgi:hypothetical protein
MCSTIETEDKYGATIKACSCKSLGPTTIINDIKDIFANNKINDIFSGNAIDAFKDFNPI